MIPRTIHYCWFGDKEKPAEVLRMIANWQKHCPGYEIKEWKICISPLFPCLWGIFPTGMGNMPHQYGEKSPYWWGNL